MKKFVESFTQYPKDLHFCKSDIINKDISV